MNGNAKQQLRIRLEGECRRLAEMLDQHLRAGIGFTLLLFDFGGDGNIVYASSAERTSMMAALRELLANLDRGEGPRGIVGKIADVEHERDELKRQLDTARAALDAQTTELATALRERDEWKREAEANGKHELALVEEREEIKRAIGFQEEGSALVGAVREVVRGRDEALSENEGLRAAYDVASYPAELKCQRFDHMQLCLERLADHYLAFPTDNNALRYVLHVLGGGDATEDGSRPEHHGKWPSLPADERHRKLGDGSPEWSIPSEVGDGPRRLLINANGGVYAGLIDVEHAYMTSANERAERLVNGLDESVSLNIEEAEWLVLRLPAAIAVARKHLVVGQTETEPTT